MTTNLRICLTVLSIGFAIEGGGELYLPGHTGVAHPGANVWFVVPAILSLIGVLFVWVGRHEWNEVHLHRARSATQIFVLSLLGGVVAALVLGLLVAYPSLGTPLWAEVLFGAGLASLLFGTFVTYAFLVFHLVTVPSKVLLGAAVVWALFISALITLSLATDLPTLLSLLQTRTLSVPPFVAPVEGQVSLLFISYFLLLVAYVDAHLLVARGRAAAEGSAPPPAPG